MRKAVTAVSDFWARRIGAKPSPPAAPAPPQQPASNRPWWMAPAPAQAPPAAPQPAEQQQDQNPAPAQDQGSVTPGGEAHFGELIRQDHYTTEKAQSARDSEPCPDCGSPNYIRPHTSKNAMKQCFNCGYNERFAHSTAGASGIGQKNLPTRTARAQTMSESTFNPQHIIGRVG